MEHVRTSTSIRRRDQRGKEREKEQSLKALNAVAQNTDRAVAIVDQLLQTVALVLLVHQVMKGEEICTSKMEMAAAYADASSTGSTYRTRLEINHLAAPLLARKIAHLAKLGLKVIALQKIAGTGTLVTVVGMRKVSAQQAKIAFFFTAVEQE